jgi:hypothetical protein
VFDRPIGEEGKKIRVYRQNKSTKCKWLAGAVRVKEITAKNVCSRLKEHKELFLRHQISGEISVHVTTP